MSGFQIVGLGLTIWVLTLFTFLLGFSQGKASDEKSEKKD